LQAATNQIRGDRHAPAAPEIENCSTRWQRIGKTLVPTLVVPITFAAVGIPLDRMSLIVSNDFVGKVRHRVQMYPADGVRNASSADIVKCLRHSHFIGESGHCTSGPDDPRSRAATTPGVGGVTCCALAISGNVIAAPPNNVMNLHCLIGLPKLHIY